jgi:predicted transcriptional regulator of viral defense system
MSDSTYDFFARYPVFTADEFAARPGSRHSQNRRAQESLLAHHVRSGRLLRLRRGLYAAVPFGVEAKAYRPDPYLIAGKMADDAVLAYHTALELHGKAHSVHEEFVFLSHRAVRKAQVSGGEFRGVSFQKALLHGRNELYGVSKTERLGMEIQVTTLERTIVDLLDRPELGGGWEEIWRSLESVEYFDLEQVVHYTLMLKNGTTAAKVGFFLDQHRKALMVEDKHLRPLKRHLPEQPCYMERSKRAPGRLVAAWRLFVPPEILNRTWEEIA